MNILVLHNNNLPICLRQGAQGESNAIAHGIELVHYAFSLPQTDIPDFDKFTSEKLAFLEKERYDLIILPYNLSETHIEYSGLRVAAHIRLTPKWNSLSTPILFLGIDKVDEIQKLSLLGGILFSNKVYHSDKTGLDELIKIFSWISNHTQLQDVSNEEIMESHEYQSLLQRLNTMPVPANYATHHTIANEWAILRWKEMINWKRVKEPILPEHSKQILSMLYFKYLIALHGSHDRFKKDDQKKSPIIEGIDGKTVVYIDDEFDKGWESILRIIFESSGAQFNCFHEFDKTLSKDQLISKIEDYVATTDADCYILDLRLHEDDFSETKNITGHEVAKFIKKQNEGNQIVVFTASNKIWNLKEELFNDEIKATGYAIKESPDQNLNREGTKQLYNDFSKCVQLACKRSYLKKLYSIQDGLELKRQSATQLRSFINLLNKDHDEKTDQDLMNAALITEIAFIEDLIIEQEGYHLRSSNEPIPKSTSFKRIIELAKIVDGELTTKRLTGHLFFKRDCDHNNVTDISEYSDNAVDPPVDWTDVGNSPVTIVSSTLLLDCQLPHKKVQEYIHLKHIRNSQSAHGSGYTIKLSPKELADFYMDVIVPVIGHFSK